MYLVISTSLNSQSNSRILARLAVNQLKEMNVPVNYIDLRDLALPLCNGEDCYAHPHSQLVTKSIAEARGILLATPIYNYQVAASAKNLIELTGRAWQDSVVGFLCAAGGKGSYMSVMSLATSLMLDFRTFILPRFLYTTEDQFEGERLKEEMLVQRLYEITELLTRITSALYLPHPAST